MKALLSAVRTSSPEFRRRYAHNKALAAQLKSRQEAARHARPSRDLERLASHGKLLPRQRLERLLDPGTPFL
jgi:3-methylcrotonyl-CoA carboxylase beta subunit